MAKRSRPENAWFTRAEMLRIFNLSDQAFDRQVRPHIPADCIRSGGKGKANRYYSRGVIDALIAAKSAPPPEFDDDDKLMLAPGMSPALEKYRIERAKLARMERMAKERSLLPTEHVHQWLGRIAAIIRGAGERLARQHGREAALVLEEAIDSVGREVDRWTEAEEA